MSMTTYAAILEQTEQHPAGEFSPVFDFDCADQEILADDADARYQRGESALIPNPQYVENAFMDLSNVNAEFLFKTLGFEVSSDEPANLEIDAVQTAVIEGLSGEAAWTERPSSTTSGAGLTIVDFGVPVAQMRRYLITLVAMIAQGKAKGATHIVVA